MAWPHPGCLAVNHFYGQLVETDLSAVPYFKGGAEGGVVFLERLQYGGALVLEQPFDFLVAEFTLVEYLRNTVAALRVHADEGGVRLIALRSRSAAEP